MSGQIGVWCPHCGKPLDAERGPPRRVVCRGCGYTIEIDASTARITPTTGLDPVNTALLKLFGPEGFASLQHDLNRTVQQLSLPVGGALQVSQTLSDIGASLKTLARMPDEIKELRSTMTETNKCIRTLSEKL